MLKVRQIAIGKLKPWEDNPRRNDRAVQAVAKSIERFGFNVPVLCDEELQVIAGHARLKAAQKLGLLQVPAITLSLQGPERTAFSIADNKTAHIADWHLPSLRAVLKELASENIRLEDLGFSELELREILGVDENEDSLREVPKENRFRGGDLIALGAHRMICRDSSETETVRRLAQNREVDLVFAGPPCFNQCGLGSWQSYESYSDDMKQVMANCASLLKPGRVVVWHIANESTVSGRT